MSGKKAKKARKNEGHRSRKVVNPILNGELVRGLQSLDLQGRLVGGVIFSNTEVQYSLAVEDAATSVAIETVVPDALMVLMAIWMAEEATEPGVYIGASSADRCISSLARVIEDFNLRYDGSESFPARFHLPDGLILTLWLDAASDSLDVHFSIDGSDTYQGDTSAYPLDELVHLASAFGCGA